MSILSSIANSAKNLFSGSTTSTSKTNPLAGIKQTTTFPSPIAAPSYSSAKAPTTPQMSMLPSQPKPVTPAKPVTSSKTTSQAAVSPAPVYSAPAGMSGSVNLNNEIANMQTNQRLYTDVNTPIPSVIPSSAMNPDNNRSTLVSTSEQLMQKLLGSIGGTPESKAAKANLARVRNEFSDRQMKYEKDLEEIKKNKQGKFGDYLDADIKALEAEYKKDVDVLSRQESNYLSEIGIYKDDVTELNDTIKTIRDLTGEDMVGSIQTDQATGNVFGYFRDPVTGTVSQRQIGSVSAGDNEQLSVAEAKSLGVPYGTTRSEAYGISAPTNMLADLTPAQATAFNGIVDKYNKSPLVAAADRTIVLKNAIKEIEADPTNAAKQLNLVYSYVQALDTYQSAVREGELSLVGTLDSKIGQFSNAVQKIQNGQIVRAEVAKGIADAAQSLVSTIDQGASQKAKSFASQANVLGLGEVWSQYQGGFTPSYGQQQPTGNVVQTKAGAIPTNW